MVLARATHSFTRADDERRTFSDFPPPPPPPISSEARRTSLLETGVEVLAISRDCQSLAALSAYCLACLYDYWPLTKNSVRESGLADRRTVPCRRRRESCGGNRRRAGGARQVRRARVAAQLGLFVRTGPCPYARGRGYEPVKGNQCAGPDVRGTVDMDRV